MSDFQKYPKYSEMWLECSVCGLDYPFSQMTRHYKTKKFVDPKCADQFGRSDLLADWDVRPEDHPTFSPQRVDTVGGAVPEGQTVGGGFGEGGFGAGGFGEGDRESGPGTIPSGSSGSKG